MFDLETAIATWRQFHARRRVFLKEDLDELERHLRDHTAHLVAQGMDEEAAFRTAVQALGTPDDGADEYRKVYWGKLKRRHQLLSELTWRFSMLTNYLKIAWRNARRHPGYSFINVAGLTLGLTCCLLIFQYVAFEYSFDTFNENADDLYRAIATEVQEGSTVDTESTFGWAFGPALAEEVPEVVRYVRLHPEYDNAVISNPAQPDKVFEETRVYYADPSFFEMFSYPLVEGERGQVLSEPGTVLLSESAAHKYFGTENPVGQILNVRGWISGDFRVSGIFADVPANSHLQFDLLLPMVDLLRRSSFSDPETGWNWTNFLTYVQLRPGADPVAAEQKFTDVLMRHREENVQATNTTVAVDAQPLRDVHLNADIPAPMAIMGSYRSVYFFTLVGLITLLIALVNYVNLATARALNRAREVGVRKVVGAHRGQLVAQFLCESALTNGLAVVLAGTLAVALRPVVNTLAGTNLTHAMWASPGFWAVFFAVFCAATLLSGLYPAFVLSSFRPVAVLKSKAGSFAFGAWLRRGLVVFQFAASIVLLIGMTIVYNQLDFMRTMDLGIDLEQILVVPSPRVLSEDTDRAQVIETFTQELRRLPAIQQTATSDAIPGTGFSFSTSSIQKATDDPSREVAGRGTWIDTSFARLYGLELAAGEGFTNTSFSTPEGEPRPLVINEAMVQALDLGTPAEAIGQKLRVFGNDMRLVGVFKDFNWSSAHEARAPAIFFLRRGNEHISLNVNTGNLPQTIAAIERIYKQHFPGDPFRYRFVDEQFDQQYRNDQRFATLFGLFAGLAIAIACLGLFGLATFTAQQRTKEIGVRKVLGATVPGIVAMLSKDFLRLVVVAFVIAAPVAYYVMRRWLHDFAYRIDISWWIFLIVGLATLGIALLTVSVQSIKVALADPVKSLRYE